MADVPLESVALTIVDYDPDWYQEMSDLFTRVGGNFDKLVARITAAVTASVRSVNGLTPDLTTGAITLPLPAGATVQVFLVSGTYTKPSTAKAVLAIGIDGGQGGQGGAYPTFSSNAAGTTAPFAPGGTGGAVRTRFLPAALLPSSVPVGVGVGGTGGVPISSQQSNGGASIAGGQGGLGAASTFGPYLTASAYDDVLTGITGASGGQSGQIFQSGGLQYGTGFTGGSPPAAMASPSPPTGGAFGALPSPISASASGAASTGSAGTSGGSDTAGGLGAGGGGGAPGQTNSNTSAGTGGTGGAGGTGGQPGAGGGGGGPGGGGRDQTSRGFGGAGGAGGAGALIVITFS